MGTERRQGMGAGPSGEVNHLSFLLRNKVLFKTTVHKSTGRRERGEETASGKFQIVRRGVVSYPYLHLERKCALVFLRKGKRKDARVGASREEWERG